MRHTFEGVLVEDEERVNLDLVAEAVLAGRRRHRQALRRRALNSDTQTRHTRIIIHNHHSGQP